VIRPEPNDYDKNDGTAQCAKLSGVAILIRKVIGSLPPYANPSSFSYLAITATISGKSCSPYQCLTPGI